MFEIEKMEKSFDYSLVDDNTADFLRSCEYEMNGIAEDARVKFGRVLKRVQDKLANHHKGVFVKWYESGGMSKHNVYYAINVYEISTNLENSQKDNFLNAPKSLQKETMKKSAPEDLKQQVYNGDITTNKEYQELLKERNKAEQAKQQAEKQVEQARKSEQIAVSQLEELENKEPEVVEKTVVKEVDHTDYKAMDLLQKERDSLERRYELLKDKVDLMESDIAESKSIKDEIASLHNSKEHIVKRMEAIEETAEYYAEIEHMLKNKLAPINYSRSLRELKDEPNVQENLNKIADMVIEWGQNLQKEISNDYVDVEIIG